MTTISLDILETVDNKSKTYINKEQKTFLFCFVLLTSALICCVVFEPEFVNSYLKIPTIVVACLSMPIMLVIQISSLSKIKPLSRKVNGEMIISNEEVVIKGAKYLIGDLDEMFLSINHYKSQLNIDASNVALPAPKRSNGAGNFIFLKKGNDIVKNEFIIPSKKIYHDLKQLNFERK